MFILIRIVFVITPPALILCGIDIWISSLFIIWSYLPWMKEIVRYTRMTDEGLRCMDGHFAYGNRSYRKAIPCIRMIDLFYGFFAKQTADTMVGR